MSIHGSQNLVMLQSVSDTELAALAGLTSAANKLPYFTGLGTAALADFTTAGRAIVDDADASAQRTTLGLGTLATQSGTFSGTSSGTNTGDQDLSSLVPTSYLDTDGTLAANSDTKVATQKAVKTYANQLIAAANAMVFQGVLDCSANPNYPAADAGDTYKVSVAGKIGGGSGPNVEIGDLLLCTADATSSGNHATVGAYWSIAQVNIDGAVTGPTSATDSNFVQFDGTTGRLVKNSTYGSSSFQPVDTELTALAGLTSAADKGIQFTGSGTAATYDLTTAGKAILDDADASAQRTTLGLVIGTNVQAYDAELAALAGLTSAADKVPYFTGAGTAATADFSAAGRALVDDADASAQRTTLGLGTLATQSGTFSVTQSSGILTGGGLSIGTGGAGVATTFTIASGTGQVVDNTVNPSTVTAVSWSAKTDVAVTDILTQLVTFVAINGSGNVVQSGTDWTPSQQRTYIVIGVVVHSNQTTVNAVNQTQMVAYAPGAQVNDLMYGLGLFNVSGNVFSSNGANLKLNKSAGSLFRRGSNYTTLSDNPHLISTGSLTQSPLRMQNQTGAGSSSGTDVDVANYDLAGVTTAISPSTRFSVLRVFLFQSNLIAVQRGQETYISLAEAKAAIQTQAYTTNGILAANGLLRGFIAVQANATSLADTAKAFFIEAGKFGGSSGVGGLSVSTLQNAYDNSSSPEILTDATRLGLTIRRGSGADTDVILEGQTNAGSTTFSVTGAGVVTGSNLSGTNTGDQTAASLGLVIGTNVQAYDADLAAIAGLTSAADKLPYFTGSGTAAVTTFTTAGRALVDDADASAQRTTLGLGTAATTNATAYAASTSPTIQKFTSSSGTYTTPAGVRYIEVVMLGAGGGGAGGGKVGAAGGTGGTGGTSTFGTTLLSCTGGAGGYGGNNGGTGGTASLGTGPIGLALSGGIGAPSGLVTLGIASGYQAGGNGAASPLGGEGGGGYTATGTAGVTNSGSGGGGGASENCTGPVSGSGGGAGGYVNAIITSPSSTYAYAIGAAGTAGSAGTNGYAGGVGGSGIIIVTEYY